MKVVILLGVFPVTEFGMRTGASYVCVGWTTFVTNKLFTLFPYYFGAHIIFGGAMILSLIFPFYLIKYERK